MGEPNATHAAPIFDAAVTIPAFPTHLPLRILPMLTS
jgi:hypothetical protein